MEKKLSRLDGLSFGKRVLRFRHVGTKEFPVWVKVLRPDLEIECDLPPDLMATGADETGLMGHTSIIKLGYHRWQTCGGAMRP